MEASIWESHMEASIWASQMEASILLSYDLDPLGEETGISPRHVVNIPWGGDLGPHIALKSFGWNFWDRY